MAAFEHFSPDGCLSAEMLAGYAYGNLPLPVLDRVADHLATCGSCFETMRGLHDSDDPLIANLRRYVPEPPPMTAAGASAPDVAGMTGSLPTRPETTVPEIPQPVGATAELGRPRIFGGYELLEVLGQGGMGVVYKARQTRLDWLVALKVIKASIASGPDSVARFGIEAKAVARLHHPHVVQIHDSGEVGGEPYYSMELLQGGSLKDRLRGKQQPEGDAAKLVRMLALGIHAAHQQHIIHRDLKPGNVLLDQDGTAKISDFGLAKLLDAEHGQTLTDAILGTPPYMAPEQARGDAKAVGPRTDVYALGAILYEMLTGWPPFIGATRMETLDKVRSESPLPVARLRRGVTPDLEAVCLKCLEKDPEQRYPSAEALADDLDRLLRGESTKARPLSLPARLWRRVRRHAVLSAAAVLVIVAAAAVSIFAATRDPARAVRRIEEQLADGQAAELFPDAAGPGWFRLREGLGSSQTASAGDGSFSVSTWDLALCELVRDPRQISYRLSMDVQPIQCEQGGTVGIYVAHQALPLTTSTLHTFLQLKFNNLRDIGDINRMLPKENQSPPPKGNPVSLEARFYAGRRNKPLCDGPVPVASPPLCKPVHGNERPWHHLDVEVSPDFVRGFWDGQLVGEMPMSQMEKRAIAKVKELSTLIPDEFGERQARPAINLRGGLGLSVFRSSANFRAGVVMPMPVLK